jgi:hypothetical protein
VRRLAVAAAIAAVLIAAAALPAQAAAKSCRDVIDTGPTGFDPADSIRIETDGVGCRTARSLANKAGRIALQGPVRIRGFTCRHGGLRRDGTFGQRCRQGSRRVSWVLGNAQRRCLGTVYIADPGITVRYWVQGVTCRRGRYVLVHSDPFPPAWRTAGRDFEGRQHVIRDRPKARIAYK